MFNVENNFLLYCIVLFRFVGYVAITWFCTVGVVHGHMACVFCKVMQYAWINRSKQLNYKSKLIDPLYTLRCVQYNKRHQKWKQLEINETHSIKRLHDLPSIINRNHHRIKNWIVLLVRSKSKIFKIEESKR